MALPRSIDDFGGVKKDGVPVEDPKIEMSAAEDMRRSEDLAHLTHTSERAFVRFATSTGSNGPIAATGGASHMGTGSADLPVIAKVGTGQYTITYRATFTDKLGIVEPVVFRGSSGRVKSISVAGHVQTIESGRVISVVILTLAEVVSDLTNGTIVEIDGR